MAYFNYHLKIHNMIRDGELVDFNLVKIEKSISPILVLKFKNGKSINITEERFEEYFKLIDEHMADSMAKKTKA